MVPLLPQLPVPCQLRLLLLLSPGENDIMAVGTDVDELDRRIGKAHVGDFIYSDYAHMDFVW